MRSETEGIRTFKPSISTSMALSIVSSKFRAETPVIISLLLGASAFQKAEALAVDGFTQISISMVARGETMGSHGISTDEQIINSFGV